METPTVLLLTLIFTVFVFIASFVLVKRRNKRHFKSFRPDWKKFELAIKEDDIESLRKYGTKLVSNVHLKLKHLKYISNSVDILVNEHPELKPLENAIYNKKLHWERSLPYP